MPKLNVKPASDRLYNELLATAFDGRGRNARYRKSQLFFLHSHLRTDLEKIRAAIKQDRCSADADVGVELALSLNAIRRLYQDIDFNHSIQEEFRITRNENNAERRIPYGVVVLKPTLRTRFFSIISALAAAFAAGNVVLLELEPSLHAVDQYFRTEFEIFDGASCIIASTRIEDATFLSRCRVVDQTTNATIYPDSLQHRPHQITIAVVDGTANVRKAASEIIASKCRFGGSSPYGVDIVLANEWVKDEFLTQCKDILETEYSTLQQHSERVQAVKTPKNSKSKGNVLLDLSGVQIKEYTRNAFELQGKPPTQAIHLLTVTGIVDAMTIAAEQGPCLALYSFSSAGEAKYLSLFIDSDICMLNQIPLPLLVGPPLPVTNHAVDLHLRYDTLEMSKPAPQRIRSFASDKNPGQFCGHAVRPFKPVKQSSGFDIGFFDRGALVGGVVIVLPTLCALIFGGYQIVATGVRNFLRPLS
ncbi:hypothetical protein LTR84_006788 [Exophiala bonariae]|uniref:Aldehyde dehydrogenase domain-containing protein n=1 Tax=Exophiala bonariae TaxID=1690606 RepID=A0AAV9N125_9EURO|nr:hypothetical protein LTR84_006788 [Exophiala bonariae]